MQNAKRFFSAFCLLHSAFYLTPPRLRTKWTTFHVSVSESFPFRPFIWYSGGAPFWMIQKISPSLEPRVQVSSVRLAGFMFFGAIVLSPAPVLPWQNRQNFAYSGLPASIAAGDDGKGAFIFLASTGTSFGGAGVWAIAEAPRVANQANATPPNSLDTRTIPTLLDHATCSKDHPAIGSSQ